MGITSRRSKADPVAKVAVNNAKDIVTLKRHVSMNSSALEKRTLRYLLFNPNVGSASKRMGCLIEDVQCNVLLPAIYNASSVYPVAQTPNTGFSVGAAAGALTANSAYRVGNRITPISLKVHIKLWVAVDETTAGLGGAGRAAIQPYVVVANHRYVKSSTRLKNSSYSDVTTCFWSPGQGSSKAYASGKLDGNVAASKFTGDRGEYISGSLNRQLIIPVKGGIKNPVLARGVGFFQGSDGGGFSLPHVERNYTINVPCPKVLHYGIDDPIDKTGMSAYPTNFAPFIAIGMSYVNGSGTAEKPLLVEASAEFSYIDA